ncbi:hypothetical protein KI387_039383, partial [Taxus chinensis]
MRWLKSIFKKIHPPNSHLTGNEDISKDKEPVKAPSLEKYIPKEIANVTIISTKNVDTSTMATPIEGPKEALSEPMVSTDNK